AEIQANGSSALMAQIFGAANAPSHGAMMTWALANSANVINGGPDTVATALNAYTGGVAGANLPAVFAGIVAHGSEAILAVQFGASPQRANVLTWAVAQAQAGTAVNGGGTVAGALSTFTGTLPGVDLAAVFTEIAANGDEAMLTDMFGRTAHRANVL